MINSTPTIDNVTADRIRQEWQTLVSALKDNGNAGDQEITDPLGQDGQVAVRLAFFKAAGGGEVLLRKGTAPYDRRYTRFRVYGETLEKTSYLIKENDHREFHKRTVEAGDKVTYVTEPEGDDKGWVSGLE